MRKSSHLILIVMAFCFINLFLFISSVRAEYEGLWSGGYVSFSVDNNNVQGLALLLCPWGYGDEPVDCVDGYYKLFANLPITGNTFGYYNNDNDYVTGTFTTPTTCTIEWGYWNPEWFGHGTYYASLVFIKFSPSSTFSPTKVNFGKQLINTNSDIYSVELENIRDVAVTGSVYLSGTDLDQFQIISGEGPFSLSPGQKKTINVQFLPTSEGTKEAILIAEGVFPCNTSKVFLSGEGIFPILNVSPTYKEVLGNSGSTTFTVSNDGSGTMNWTVSTDSPWITDINPSSGTNNGIVTVDYAQIEGSERIAQITVTADGADNSPETYEILQNDDVWKLTADDGGQDDNFGKGASISGNYAVVCTNGEGSSEVYVYERAGIEWIKRAKLTASDDDIGAARISGDYVIVSAACGAAYIFEKPAGGWTDMTETAKLTPSNGTGCFGGSISISGDYAIVGNSGDGNAKGSAYIFQKPINGWADMTETAKLTASDGYSDHMSGDRFGNSVSISGDYAIVGAYLDDDNGTSSGSAYIFEKPFGGWTNMTETAKLTPSDGTVYDYFGSSVSISGDYAVVAGLTPVTAIDRSGSAYIFEKPSGGWVDMTESAKLTPSDGTEHDSFGNAVSISGDYAIVGASDGNGIVSNSGASYIFERPSGGWVDMNETMKLAALDGAMEDQFGHSVGISMNYAIVGSNLDDDNGSSSGSAYFFKLAEVPDNYHFEFTEMDPLPPHVIGAPFSVTVEAKDNENITLSSITRECRLSAIGDSGPLPIQPENITVVKGKWTGDVRIFSTDTNIVLSVDDGLGHTSETAPFSVVTGSVDHFEFSEISSPQVSGVSFPITLITKDSYGNIVSDFGGSLSLTGYGGVDYLCLWDGFEDGDYNGWIEGTSSLVTRYVTNDTAAVGDYSLTLYNGNIQSLRSGISYFFDEAQQPEKITFYVRSGNAAKSDGYFVLGPQGGCPIFFYMSSNGTMYANEETSFNYSANIWYEVQFVIDWTEGKFDLYANNNCIKTGIVFRDPVPSFSTIYLFNYSFFSQAWWDEIQVGDETSTPIPIAPTTTGNFVSGSWTGNLTVQGHADEMFVIADDGNGHTVQSNIFNVLSDTDGDRLPDEIETGMCPAVDDPDSDDDGILDGFEDANQNGAIGIGETDPCNSDTDNDGIQDGTEIGITLTQIGPGTDTSVFVPDADPSTTTDPLDADNDNDGLLDGQEDRNGNGQVDEGETDPIDSDTDNDGIQDGTEMGITLSDIGPDTDTGIFVPDEDPTTTTKPLDADSDNDGLLDGEEDLNHNGRVDPGESDPNPKPKSLPFIPLLLLNE